MFGGKPPAPCELGGVVVLLIIPVLAGWVLARNALRERDPLSAGLLAVALGLALMLLGVNGVYQLADLPTAIFVSLAVCAGVAGGHWWLRPEPLQRRPIPLAVRIWLVLAVVAIYLFSNLQQVSSPDDDYWIHAPLQGLMLKGNFPPYNPFFSAIPMNGHYGRNLSMITVSYLTGMDTFATQLWMTNFLQVLNFLLLFVTFQRFTGSAWQALLGAGFMYFGVNVGGRGGLMDTLQNNNPYVHLYLALSLQLILYAWESLRPAAAVLAGLVLGGYGIVYETHFGLVCLAVAAVAPLFVLTNRKRGRAAAITVLILAIAGPIAGTQGGPLTNIVMRKLRGERTNTQQSAGMLNQSQVVVIKFPKAQLFKILMGEHQRISCAYRTRSFLRWFDSPPAGYGYFSIFTWEVFKLHFLPLYLAPFSLYLLWRGGPCWPGLLLWVFGVISYLIPGLVDFGPVYEAESFRWEFAAGLGLAAALGLATGRLVEARLATMDALDWTYESDDRRLLVEIAPRGLVWVAVAAFVWLNTLPCRQFLDEKLRGVEAWGGWGRAVISAPTVNWMQMHTALDFDPIDWRAARWLAPQVTKGQRLLTNFRDEDTSSILFESTLTGVCGARCVGHALPLDDEAVGTTPYHMAAPARAFWATHDPVLLEQLGVDWVYLRPRPGLENLDGVAGLEKVHEETEPSGAKRLIYHFQRSARDYTVGAPTTAPSGLQLSGLQLPAHARGGRFYPVKATLSNVSSGLIKLSDSFLYLSTRQLSSGLESTEVDRVLQPLEGVLQPGQSQTVTVWLMAPYMDGDYELHPWLGDRQASRPVALEAPAVLTVDFLAWLRSLTLTDMNVSRFRYPGALVTVACRLQAPFAYPTEERVLALVAACNPDNPEDYYLLPAVNMSEQDLVSRGTEVPVILPAMLPHLPGRYRMDLFLVGRQGFMMRYPGTVLEVTP